MSLRGLFVLIHSRDVSVSLFAASPFPNWFKRPNCFVIAEAGVNHNGQLNLALQLVEAAAKAGADAVKFQLFNPHLLCAASAPLAPYQKVSYQQQQTSKTNHQQNPASQQALLQGLTLSHKEMKQLAQAAKAAGLLFLCTPFDWEAAQFLVHELGVPFLKLSSGDLTTGPFLQQLCTLNVPLLLSTGMATLQEVQATVAFLQQCWQQQAKTGSTPLQQQVALLHCTSAYPAPDDTLNLSALTAMHQAFPDLVLGYSDHSLGLEASVGAVALGAKVVEKHMTLDATLPGPDHAASLPVEQLAAYVKAVKRMATMVGQGQKTPHACEVSVTAVARKSLVTASTLPAGHVLTANDLLCKRPGTGLSPMLFKQVVGKTLKRLLPADAVLTQDDLQ